MVECKKCGTVFQDNEIPEFCSACGASLTEETPVTVAEVPFVEPVVVKPARNKGAMGMAIVGMGLGIEGLFGLFATFALCWLGFVGGAEEAVGSLFMTLLYAVLFGGGNVAALILANKAESYGELSGMQKAAKITGLVGIIAHGVAVLMALTGAMVAYVA